MNSVHISVVIPVYGHQLQLEKLYTRLQNSLLSITEEFEIIMVNDQSPDNAWEVIKQLAKKNKRVRGINLTRNFGQHHALTAGLDHARGDWVIMMDCDLQDQPEEIIKLYNEALKGYDIVYGQRKQRNDGWIKRFLSLLFYKLLRFMSGIDHDPSIANFGIYSKNVIKSVLEYREQIRSIGMFLHHIGNTNYKAIPIVHAEREKGVSAYNFKKKMDFAFSIILANSNKPLKLSITLGFFMSCLSVTYILWLVIRYFLYGIGLVGWTSVIVSVYFLSGLILINIGFLGLYISRIYNETKKRPIYHIHEITS